MADLEAPLFLKLGGSLITDKRCSATARHDVLARLADEIAAAQHRMPALQIVLGHGSGSFGHVVGSQYQTRSGVTDADGWYGFARTADAAAQLNRLVIAALLHAGVPAWTLQPSSLLHCRAGRIKAGATWPIEAALQRGLVPVVHGDVALDSEQGGTIASTEEIFEWLATTLPPSRILLLGEVDGIYTADPQVDESAQPIAQITPATYADVRSSLAGSHGVDVTGGMQAKVAQMIALVRARPGLEIRLASGLIAGNLLRLLTDPAAEIGTRISG